MCLPETLEAMSNPSISRRNLLKLGLGTLAATAALGVSSAEAAPVPPTRFSNVIDCRKPAVPAGVNWSTAPFPPRVPGGSPSARTRTRGSPGSTPPLERSSRFAASATETGRPA